MNTPERIWLINMGGDDICWHDDPNPTGMDDDIKPDAAEYVSAGVHAALQDKLDTIYRKAIATDTRSMKSEQKDFVEYVVRLAEEDV